MGKSLSTQLLQADTDMPCPNCEYPVWILLAEVVAQTAVLCPCCRCRIWLNDTEGSVQNAGEVIEQQIHQALKGLFR